MNQKLQKFPVYYENHNSFVPVNKKVPKYSENLFQLKSVPLFYSNEKAVDTVRRVTPSWLRSNHTTAQKRKTLDERIVYIRLYNSLVEECNGPSSSKVHCLDPALHTDTGYFCKDFCFTFAKNVAYFCF